MIKDLIKLANALDEAGFKKEADAVDAIIKNAIAAPIAAPAAAPVANPAAGIMLLLAILLLIPDIREETRRLIEDLIETILPSYSGEDAVSEPDRGGAEPSSKSDSYDEAWPENLEDGFPGDGPSESQSEQIETLRRALEDAKDIEEGDYPVDAEGRETPSIEDVKRDIDKILKEMDKIFGKRPAPIGDTGEEERESRSVSLSCFAMSNGENVRAGMWWFYYDLSHIPEGIPSTWCNNTGKAKYPSLFDLLKETGGIRHLSGHDNHGGGEPNKIEHKIIEWARATYPDADEVIVRNHAGSEVHCNALAYNRGAIEHMPVMWSSDGVLYRFPLK